MTSSLLNRVKSRLYLRARRAVTHLLDGQYASIHRGRSLDFNDLREYVPGDEIGDIDWKATARSGETLVRRYTAERRHRILFVVDSGRNLGVNSAAGDPKYRLAIETVGVLGWLAIRHGDEVGLLLGDEKSATQLPFRASESALERALWQIEASGKTQDAHRSDLPGLLERVRRTVRHRTALVVIADEIEFDDDLERLISTLAVQHELVWIELADAVLAGEDAVLVGAGNRGGFDVDGSWSMPSALQLDRRLQREYEAAVAQRRERMRAVFDRHGISVGRVADVDAVAPELLRLLKARRHARA